MSFLLTELSAPAGLLMFLAVGVFLLGANFGQYVGRK